MKLDTLNYRKYIKYLDESYSPNVRNNYTYYARKLFNQEINQELVDSRCQGSHAVYRSFIKTLINCFKLRDITIERQRKRTAEKEIVYYTEKEMKFITNALYEWMDWKHYLMVKLQYENGLRISEVLNIQIKDIDWTNKRIRGIGKGNKEFNIRIFKNTYRVLLHFIRWHIKTYPGDDFPFMYHNIGHQRQKALYELKKLIAYMFPNKEEKLIFCHAFRHSCGTHLRDKGFDLREIQEYLRHKQLQTVACYTAIDKRKLEQKVEGEGVFE